MPICDNKVRNGPDSADQGRSKAAATMSMAYHDYVHPPPHHTFLLAQNLSSKWIAPTNNMQPKSDNTKKHHRWLKG